MMMNLCSEIITRLHGKTLVTAESCTGGMIGAALTAVPGSSAVFKGGVISYTNWVKENILGVGEDLLKANGPVCASVAEAMARGAREKLEADISVSVTGLAGPGGDEYGNPEGTVYIGFADEKSCFSWKFLFSGCRDMVRQQATEEALKIILGQI